MTVGLNLSKILLSDLEFQAEFDRIKTGNLGDWKPLSEGICELKLHFSSGYRIYYSELDNIVLLLLCGGDKSSQERDIKKAIEYLKDYKERIHEK